MKAGIWGTGNIAETHAASLKSLGINISAVVDTNIEKAQFFAKKWGVQSWSDNPEILLHQDIFSVHVCTPPALHYDMVHMLIENSKHVLCEKPLCLKSEEVHLLEQLAKANGVTGAVNYNVRFYDACQQAYQMINSESFGDIYMVHGSYLQEFHVLPVPYGWRYEPKLAGRMRAVTEIGTHWFDLAMFLSMKKITKVSAMFGHHQPSRYLENGIMIAAKDHDTNQVFTVDSEDSAFILFQFEDGAIGSVVLSEVSQGRSNQINIEITGENKNLWWNSEVPAVLNSASKGTGIRVERFDFGNNSFGDSFRELIKVFYQVIQNNEDVNVNLLPGFKTGAEVASVCEAVMESAYSKGQWKEVKCGR